ncbi:MAG: hypothetical protein OEY14_14650, partial [Myxococcales bacterium]|nr:hypothetical protein [Myxococcales bacterium]
RAEVRIRFGAVVGVHVEGGFDPLLTRLRGRGAIETDALRRALLEVGAGRRAGDAARREGVEGAVIREALRTQAFERLQIVASWVAAGARLRFESGAIPMREASTLLLGSELPGHASSGRRAETRPCAGSPSSPGPASGSRARGAAQLRGARSADRPSRAELRRLALALHPDRHPDLPAALRDAMASRLADLTALHHGL